MLVIRKGPVPNNDYWRFFMILNVFVYKFWNPTKNRKKICKNTSEVTCCTACICIRRKILRATWSWLIIKLCKGSNTLDGWIGMERDVDQTEGGYVRRESLEMGSRGIGAYGTVIQELGRKTGVYIRGLWGGYSPRGWTRANWVPRKPGQPADLAWLPLRSSLQYPQHTWSILWILNKQIFFRHFFT